MALAPSQIATQAIEGELRLILTELLGDAAAMLDGEGRNDTRGTRDGLFSVIETTGNTTTGVFGSNGSGALFAHEGRKPGKRPPIQAIRPWVERKLGVPESESAGVAYVVARRIGQRGTPGTPYLTRPFETKRAEIGPRIASAVGRALNNVTPDGGGARA